jgi:hypothetical protein
LDQLEADVKSLKPKQDAKIKEIKDIEEIVAHKMPQNKPLVAELKILEKDLNGNASEKVIVNDIEKAERDTNKSMMLPSETIKYLVEAVNKNKIKPALEQIKNIDEKIKSSRLNKGVAYSTAKMISELKVSVKNRDEKKSKNCLKRFLKYGGERMPNWLNCSGDYLFQIFNLHFIF